MKHGMGRGAVSTGVVLAAAGTAAAAVSAVLYNKVRCQQLFLHTGQLSGNLKDLTGSHMGREQQARLLTTAMQLAL
jgi:acyl dehydratase